MIDIISLTENSEPVVERDDYGVPEGGQDGAVDEVARAPLVVVLAVDEHHHRLQIGRGRAWKKGRKFLSLLLQGKRYMVERLVLPI